MRRDITKRAVDALRAGARTEFLWDTKLPGFGVRMTPNGVRSYVLQWQDGRRSRRLTIGRHGAPWTPDTARREALRLKAEIVAGIDPAERRALRRAAPTVREFAAQVMEEHWRPKRKARTVSEYQKLLDRWVFPAFGSKPITDLTRADVARLHHEMRARPYAANRVLAIVSKMCNLAEAWGLRGEGTNPTRHVERFREKARRRFLSPAELARLGEVLRRAKGRRRRSAARPAPYAVDAIRLLLFTGARVGEILALRWSEVDLEEGRLHLADSKTGEKTITLSAPAVAVLKRLPRVAGNEHVLPSLSREGGHLAELRASWRRIRAEAGLDDVRLHDLRHSFASVAASSGESLIVIGAMLGHRQPSTTARYAHLSDDPVRAAVDRVAADVARALDGDQS